MRALLALFAVLFGLLSTFAVIHSAHADERLILPFSCKAGPSGVALTPGPSQSYRIYGAAEHRSFTACSPANPGFCRNWMVHRFDLDCSGTRVSWLSVADALGHWTGGRTIISNGKLLVRQGPWWAGPPAGPCYFGPRFGHMPWQEGPPPSWRGGPPPFDDQPCAEAGSYTQQQYVAMPAGFAPTMGVYAQFASSPHDVPQIGAAFGKGPQVLTGAHDRAAIAGSLPPLTHPTQSAALEPSSAPMKHVSEVSAPTKTPSAGKHLASMPAKPIGASAKTSKPDAAEKALTTASAQTRPREAADPEITGSISSRRPAALARLALPAFVLGSLMLFLGAALLFAFMRREDRLRLTSFSLGERRIEPQLGTPLTSGTAAATVAERSAPSPMLPEWLPRTRADALQVLGATAEAGEDALKRIVRRLRQTWHPDLASQEDERHLREQRLKQINVAWDILSGKRAAAKA